MRWVGGSVGRWVGGSVGRLADREELAKELQMTFSKTKYTMLNRRG